MTFSHKSSGRRRDPGVFLQIAFSVPQQLWNYSFLKNPFEFGEVITSDGNGRPSLEQLRESDITIAQPH